MLRVQVHPGAARSAIHGFRADGSLKLEVTATPEAGRADQAVTRLLAAALDLPHSRITVVRGAGSRSKVLAIQGLTEAEVRARLGRAGGEVSDGD